MWRLLFSLLPIVYIGCDRTPRPIYVNMTLQNDSPHLLNWTELVWNGPYLTGGMMGVGFGKTAIMAPWPSDTTATITFIDWQTKVEYAIDLSFPEIAEQVLSGKCKHVVFVIEDYDRASVRCRYP
jgi:hypothetical protein